MTWQNLHELLLALAFLLGPLEADGWPSCLAATPPGDGLSAEVCKAKGMSVGPKENRLLSPALRFTPGFAIYSTWYRGLPFPCEKGDGEWVSVSPLGTGAVLSLGVYIPRAAVPYLFLFVASALRADVANLKPSTFLILTCVKPGELGGQRFGASLEN